VSDGPAIDAERVIADLRELARRTSDERGAQRLCWTETWRDARVFLAELLEEIGVEPERDEAGNLWARLGDAAGPALALGSHIDSVPDGGWLDGALGVMAGLGVLRTWAAAGEPPPRSLVLIDWADEEGARFGHSLFGSSAFAGHLDVEAARSLHDADGTALADALAENGVELDAAPRAGARRDGLAAYLELHIEQGPVLEADGTGIAAVEGCVGIERHRFAFTGQAAHAGTTPMDRRRDAGLAAAETALRVEAIANEHGGMGTTGVLALRPGIPTAVAGHADLVVDLRHAAEAELTRMLAEAQEAGAAFASARNCSVSSELVWRIEPTRFDEHLVELAAEASGGRRMTSGALHDAAEVARVLPAAMMFVPSIGGISHAKEEDTSESDLAAGIEAFGALANVALARGV
jgi:N-carbamoyl-L-amino-acid hydrolase